MNLYCSLPTYLRHFRACETAAAYCTLRCWSSLGFDANHPSINRVPLLQGRESVCCRWRSSETRSVSGPAASQFDREPESTGSTSYVQAECMQTSSAEKNGQCSGRMSGSTSILVRSVGITMCTMQARARIQPIVEIFSPPLALAPVPPPFMRAINRRQSNGRSPRVLGPSREILRHGQLGLLGPLGKSVTTPVPTFFAHPWMLGRGCPEPGARPP